MKAQNLAVLFCLFAENAHIDLVGLEGIFEITHIYVVFQGIRKLLAVIFLLERRQQEIFIPLVDVLGAPTGSLVDGVYDNA